MTSTTPSQSAVHSHARVAARTLALVVRTRVLSLVLCLAGLGAPATAAPAAAAPRPSPSPQLAASKAGTLTITATDTQGGRLPGADVTLVGPVPAATATSVVTDEQGQARYGDLAPGVYQVEVAMPGFAPARIAALRVAPGQAAAETVTLQIDGFAEQVEVSQGTTDRQLQQNFTETLGRAEIEQLPDDAEELTAVLEQLAGPEMELRVNGFEGGTLPPKAQIQAIRIRQDPFAPDSRGAGRPRVEIITRPGTSAWRHEVNVGFRDQSFAGRNAFASERRPGRTGRVGWSLSGPLVKNRTSLALNIGTRQAVDTLAVIATRPDGPVNEVVNRDLGWMNAEVRVEHALTAAHTLRAEYQRYDNDGQQLGVGEFNLRERAYEDEGRRHILRLSNTGTFGKKAFNEARVEYMQFRSDVRSASDAVTVNVQNAFTSGGAQLQGGARDRELEIADDLELIFSERHKMRLGFETEFGWSHNDRMSNATGTFTFASLDDYAAGRPLQFVQRLGDPLVEYARNEFSWYVHDELRLGDRVQLGLGLRHDFQSYLDDKANFAPRGSIAWTPFEHGKTTLRAGAGIFYDWYNTGLYEQTLRVDGVRQRDLLVVEPGWPDPFVGDDIGDGEGDEGGSGIVMPPPSIIRAGDDLSMETTRRVSAGVEHALTDALQLRVNVFDESTLHRYRSADVNAPVATASGGQRPDPAFARITEIRSIGRAEERGVDLSVRARSDAKRMFGVVRYRYAHDMNDGDDALALPVDSGDLGAEWGPAAGDIRHRVFGYARVRLPYGVGVGVNTEIRSGVPYTIRTGFDDNGDAVTNDRPEGVGRNTERGEWQQNVDLRLSWGIGGEANRPRQAQANRPAPQSDVPQVPRGFEVYTQVWNLLNTTNFNRYSGVMTSPFFGQPIAALSARRMELGMRLFF